METLKIKVEDLTDEKIKSLKAGDLLLLSGEIYTARDAAHERMVREAENGKELPFDIKGKAIYYAGPCPAKPGRGCCAIWENLRTACTI